VKIRKLTPLEFQTLKDRALEAFAQDASTDWRYAVETVAALADECNKPAEWWMEILSTDENVWEEMLGFDPSA
jgi:hypothetical protein